MNWTCPYCARAQVVTELQQSTKQFAFETVEPSGGFIGLRGLAIVCANTDCRRATVLASICEAYQYSGSVYIEKNPRVESVHRLMPTSFAKPLPDYIPEPIREDYYEACGIRDLSPKASATLCRRCLQGMIRDFGKIKGRTLFKEVDLLRKGVEEGSVPHGVSPESVEALDHIRSIGNIGAHMEEDINVIVPVEADEAQLLIELLETLFEDWYVRQHKRTERFARVKEAAESKQLLRSLPKPDEAQ